MSFWNKVTELDLQEFRPGILSLAHLGEGLVMAVMEIGPEMEDPGHEHPFDQCGIVVEGEIRMSIGDEHRLVRPMEAYFIPAGVFHGWKTLVGPVKILDVSARQN